MYKIEISDTLNKIFWLFHILGMWSNDETSLRELGPKLFYFMHFVSINISLTLAVHESTDKDECIFLTVTLITALVHLYRMCFIFFRKNEILLLVHEIGTQHTNDRNEFEYSKNKLKIFLGFVNYFLSMILIGFLFAVIVFPVVSEKRLFFNISIPFRSNKETAFWMELLYNDGGIFLAVVCCAFNSIPWCLMMSFVLKYEMLGNRMQYMGTTRISIKKTDSQLKLSIVEQQKLYVEDFIAVTQALNEING